MGACGATSVGDVRGWDHDGGDSLGKDVPPYKRGGGVSGRWGSRGFVEGVISSGELLPEKECCVA